MKFDVIAFTKNGALLAEKLLGLFPGSGASAPEAYCTGRLKPIEAGVGDWVKARFKKGGALVFIGSTGIAVRAVAPFLRSKAEDAAVICIDERGENVIPLLSGHIGGANRLAEKLAEAIGARAVITTATDINGVFAADVWASENNCAIADVSAIKMISSALLNGEIVGLVSEFPVEGSLPTGVSFDTQTEKGIEIALTGTNPFRYTLRLIPRIIAAGIGCRKGALADIIERRLRDELAKLDIPLEAVCRIASIDIKAGEPGLLKLCERIGAEFVTFSAGELMSAEGDFSKSGRVLAATGADNVCERAVVLSGAEIISGKSAGDGVTIALGKIDYRLCFIQEA